MASAMYCKATECDSHGSSIVSETSGKNHRFIHACEGYEDECPVEEDIWAEGYDSDSDMLIVQPERK